VNHDQALRARFFEASERITDAQADLIVTLDEGQFSDVKALDIEPAKLGPVCA
jgi:hypothetical protein